MLKFMIYDILDTRAVFRASIGIDPTDSRYANDIKFLFELEKDKKVYVQPVDADGVHFLTKPRPRGRVPLADDIVICMHELFVEDNKSPIRILVELHNRFGIEVNSNQLNDVLSQKKYTDVPGIDHLRELAKEKMPKKPDRRTKITKEMKKEWVRLHVEENMSGNAIAKLDNVSSVSVNTHLRSQFGYRSKK